MNTENRDRLDLRMGPDAKRKIDRWYGAAGCHRRNQFVEQSVDEMEGGSSFGMGAGICDNCKIVCITGKIARDQSGFPQCAQPHTDSLSAESFVKTTKSP